MRNELCQSKVRYQFRTAAIVSRRLTLLSALVVGMLLLLVVQRSSPLIVDLIVRTVDVIGKAPITLISVLALLGLTMIAGAWATVMGMREREKRVRISRRHKRHI